MNTVDAKIHQMFTCLLYCVNLEHHQKLNNYFYKQILKIQKQNQARKANWNCNTFSSLDIFDLRDDEKFRTLSQEILTHFRVFAEFYGADISNLNMKDAWINLAKPGSFQEYHNHPNAHFSFVYYAKVSENSGNIIFQSFESITDMFPVPIKTLTPLSFKNFQYTPKECDLLIFRSNIQHMVGMNMSDEDRVSISGNFVIG